MNMKMKMKNIQAEARKWAAKAVRLKPCQMDTGEEEVEYRLTATFHGPITASQWRNVFRSGMQPLALGQKVNEEKHFCGYPPDMTDAECREDIAGVVGSFLKHMAGVGIRVNA